jgi:hypothetical protein
MYLSIVLLPVLGALAAGLRGRALGVTGAQLVSTFCVLASTALSLVAFYEVALCRSAVTINLASWVTTEGFTANWSLLFDDLTVSMLLPVLIVSSCVHVYSVSYMADDPHCQRFFAYLSMFTAFMLLLVSADSYLLMFVGWEGIGISSFLLIGFWTSRVQAGKSAVMAMTINRVGDIAVSIGFFALVWLCSSLDYATVLSTAPYLNETALTVIGLLLLGGAMSKSAQLPLHTWLPAAMEGFKRLLVVFIVGYVIIIFPCDDSCCTLKIGLPAILAALDKTTLSIMTANMLGDGSLQRTKTTTAARFSICVGPKTLTYLYIIFDIVYGAYCNTGIREYVTSKGYVQYSFTTLTDPIFTALHDIWYVFDPLTLQYTKSIPLFIAELMNLIVLALWIIEDGFFDNHGRTKTVVLCTESFTYAQCVLLQEALLGLGILTTLKMRNKAKNAYRVRISKRSMPLVRCLALPYMPAQYHYKLGPH